jgi:hypothetical protein
MFNYYPDGYLVQLIREPVSWYSSIKARVLAGRGASLPIYQGLDPAVKAYVEQAKSIQYNLDEFAGRCILIDYDVLAKTTPSVMDGLLNVFGIRATQIATIPTFNSRPIGPNSSFRGIPYSREDILEAGELQILQDEALPAYAAVRKRARFSNDLQ